MANTFSDDPTNPDARGFLWAKVRCFSSNCLLVGPTEIRLGSFITGVATASYNGSNRAILDVWPPTDVMEWRFTAFDTLIQADEVFRFAPWAVFGPIIIIIPPYPAGSFLGGDHQYSG